jgi:hypothetical protein
VFQFFNEEKKKKRPNVDLDRQTARVEKSVSAHLFSRSELLHEVESLTRIYGKIFVLSLFSGSADHFFLTRQSPSASTRKNSTQPTRDTHILDRKYISDIDLCSCVLASITPRHRNVMCRLVMSYKGMVRSDMSKPALIFFPLQEYTQQNRLSKF